VDLEGRYTDGFLEYAGAARSQIYCNELRSISSPADFVGLNIFSAQFYVVAFRPARRVS